MVNFNRFNWTRHIVGLKVQWDIKLHYLQQNQMEAFDWYVATELREQYKNMLTRKQEYQQKNKVFSSGWVYANNSIKATLQGVH